jgi:hypothetical protein
LRVFQQQDFHVGLIRGKTFDGIVDIPHICIEAWIGIVGSLRCAATVGGCDIGLGCVRRRYASIPLPWFDAWLCAPEKRPRLICCFLSEVWVVPRSNITGPSCRACVEDLVCLYFAAAVVWFIGGRGFGTLCGRALGVVGTWKCLEDCELGQYVRLLSSYRVLVRLSVWCS